MYESVSQSGRLLRFGVIDGSREACEVEGRWRGLGSRWSLGGGKGSSVVTSRCSSWVRVVVREVRVFGVAI